LALILEPGTLKTHLNPSKSQNVTKKQLNSKNNLCHWNGSCGSSEVEQKCWHQQKIT